MDLGNRVHCFRSSNNSTLSFLDNNNNVQWIQNETEVEARDLTRSLNFPFVFLCIENSIIAFG